MYKIVIYIKSFLNIFFWYVLTPITLFLVTAPITFPIVYALENKVEIQIINFSSNDLEFSSIDSTYDVSFSRKEVKGVNTAVQARDYRALVLDEYFRQNGSPLEGLGDVFIEKCEKYDAPYDCTTLPAIAHVETGLCNYGPAQVQKNCWGFGGAGVNRIYFDSYEDAIDLITDRLVNSYGPEYMTDPVSMQYTYCGAHCDKWGGHVQNQRIVINNLSVKMGFPKLFKN